MYVKHISLHFDYLLPNTSIYSVCQTSAPKTRETEVTYKLNSTYEIAISNDIKTMNWQFYVLYSELAACIL